jgi:hypothetical protein
MRKVVLGAAATRFAGGLVSVKVPGADVGRRFTVSDCFET